MAKNSVARVSSKMKANKKVNSTKANKAKPAPGKLRLAARQVTAPPVAGYDYAIWDIGFYHWDDVYYYYYPVWDDSIDSALELYIMGEASPSSFLDTHILVKVDRPDGTNVVAEAAAPHFGNGYPASWIATIPAGSLAAASSYIVKVRQYQDKAAASSEFATT